MIISGHKCDQIVISSDDGEVLAVISDNEIIEKNGCKVTLDLA